MSGQPTGGSGVSKFWVTCTVYIYILPYQYVLHHTCIWFLPDGCSWVLPLSDRPGARCSVLFYVLQRTGRLGARRWSLVYIFVIDSDHICAHLCGVDRQARISCSPRNLFRLEKKNLHDSMGVTVNSVIFLCESTMIFAEVNTGEFRHVNGFSDSCWILHLDYVTKITKKLTIFIC